ncbi:MAG: tRNA uridine-5-carboxymethylaminomethyl modification enzyme MnmG/GidA [Phycisphaeraceae bacterium]
MTERNYEVIVIGGGHAGAEAAWAASHALAADFADSGGRRGRVALVTLDPTKIGTMSCNPAIGGLAKGQIVREIDALGGLMGLAADATGIQFKVLNASKGPAVRGPRCQSDKYAYAEAVQRLLRTRENLEIVAGSVERLIVEDGVCGGVVVQGAEGPRGLGAEDAQPAAVGAADAATWPLDPSAPRPLTANAVVLTTGTFMRGLMHTGATRTPGGRVGEAAATGISDELRRLGFELGRLKTGTPPRLDGRTIDYDAMEVQPGDDEPTPFSAISALPEGVPFGQSPPAEAGSPGAHARCFPVLPQVDCHITHTSSAIHDAIRANLDRAPMYNGQIQSTAGPRYCPSIEDKVVRFAERDSHHVFLEPESLRTHEIYCNGISTSLPQDVQEFMVHSLPGCERATILRHGYAVEYDTVLTHQLDATTMTKRLPGLFLAGQINGTTGYEEAAGQGWLAGINAVRFGRGEDMVALGRDRAYIGVLMDDLVTKTPVEPYRMFTSRAEHRLLLRADNACERLTELGRELGTVEDVRWSVYEARRESIAAVMHYLEEHREEDKPLTQWARSPRVEASHLRERLADRPLPPLATEPRVLRHVLAELQYAGYVDRQQREIDRLAASESTPLPHDLDYRTIIGLRAEAASRLAHYRPATLGQARRIEGVNPADLVLVDVALRRRQSVA